VAQECH